MFLKSIVEILIQAVTRLISLGLLMLLHWEPGVLKEYFQLSATTESLNFSHFSKLTHFIAGVG